MNQNRDKLKKLYNKKTIKINENYLNSEIIETKTIKNNFIDLYHYPFLNKCKTLPENNKKYNVIVYTINEINDNKCVYFYLNLKNDIINFINVLFDNEQKILNYISNEYNLNNLLIRGTLQYNYETILFIQSKNSQINLNKWLTYYDIAVNKQFYNKHIENSVINFFRDNMLINKLYYNNKLSKQPLVLYSYESKDNYDYINKYKNLYYKRIVESYKLSDLKKHNTDLSQNILIRHICFLDRQDDIVIQNNIYYLLNLNNNISYIEI